MGEQGVRPRESQPDSSNWVYFHLWIVSSIFRFLGLKERHREGRKGGREPQVPTASVLARLSALSHAQGPCWLSCGQGTVGVARLGCRRLSSLSAKWQCHGCGPRAETKGVPAQGYGPLQPRARMPAPTVLRFGRTSSRPLALNPTPGCQREGKPEPVLRSSEETVELSTACGAPGLVRQACLAHAELDTRATSLRVDSRSAVSIFMAL